MIRLLIADDHGLMREGLKRLFDVVDDIEVVGEAVDGEQVINAVKHDDIDILLLDMTMPGVSGVNLIKEVHALNPNLPILVLSMHDEVSVVKRALMAGVKGYITKETNDPRRLLKAICTVAEGGQYIDQELAVRMAFDQQFGRPTPHSKLTRRELEIFKLMAQGLSINEIATRLFISNKTVSTHKARLMDKMSFTKTSEIFRYALEHQLID